MKIKSLINENNRLIVAEVEISLLPGLPQIQFLGLPDQLIKESVHRIKSAIQNQNYELPRAHQVLVNIRPSYLKKSSRGIELAVAAAILWKTEQVVPPANLSNVIVYGELGLAGEVIEPDDLHTHYDEDFAVMTGLSNESNASFDRYILPNLQQLVCPEILRASELMYKVERPFGFETLSFPADQARLLEIVALGAHSVMLAGPAGSGKTTIAKVMHSLMSEPIGTEMKEIRKNSGKIESWRPIIQPHHSSTPLSLIGGGVPPRQGEFSRAHLGMLILDEFLEFPGKAQEALREPMEEGKIRLSRGNKVAVFPAMAQVVACTNLCPCGDWVPKARVRCSRTLQKCREYVNRLSGPLADRFQILFFTQKYKDSSGVSYLDILRKVEKARNFRIQRAEIENCKMDRESLVQQMDGFTYKHLMPKEFASRRRELSTLRVARSLADLDGSEIIQKQHLEEALDYTLRPFERLKGLD